MHHFNILLKVGSLFILLKEVGFHFLKRFLFESIDLFDLLVNLIFSFFEPSVLHFEVQESHSDPVDVSTAGLAKLLIVSYIF